MGREARTGPRRLADVDDLRTQEEEEKERFLDGAPFERAN